MIVTNKFVFIHLHKSGGTFVNKVIQGLFPSARQIGYHYPLNMLPREYHHLPLLGAVRNPWDFYVSYYTFQKTLLDQFEAKQAILSVMESESPADRGADPRNDIDILFEFLAKNGTLSFAETTANFLNLGTSGRKLDEVLEVMPTELGRRAKAAPVQREGFRGMNVTRDDLQKIRGTREGLYAFLFRRMYDEAQGGLLPQDRHFAARPHCLFWTHRDRARSAGGRIHLDCQTRECKQARSLRQILHVRTGELGSRT